MAQSFPPDTISTDLHKASRMLPNATMPITMSKFLNLGHAPPRGCLSLDIQTCRGNQVPSARPTLSVGAEADLAAFALYEGDFAFVDSVPGAHAGSEKTRMRANPESGPSRLGPKRPVSLVDWDKAGEYRHLA